MTNTKVDNYNATTSNASIVAQFTVYTNSKNLSNLLNILEENNLNIYAFTIHEENNNLKFRFIIGRNSSQSSMDINLTRSILKQYKFKFDETKAIKLSTDNNNLLANQYKALIKTLTVFNSYIAQDGSVIYETCCPTKTLKVLNELY